MIHSKYMVKVQMQKYSNNKIKWDLIFGYNNIMKI